MQRSRINPGVHSTTTWCCLRHHQRMMHTQDQKQEENKRMDHTLSGQHDGGTPSSRLSYSLSRAPTQRPLSP